jgi:hypothetical protein
MVVDRGYIGFGFFTDLPNRGSAVAVLGKNLSRSFQETLLGSPVG